MKFLKLFVIIGVSVFVMGCGFDWTFGLGGGADEPKEPSSEEVKNTEDPQKLKQLAEDARLLLVAEKKKLEAEKKKNAELQKKTKLAESAAERANLLAEKKDNEKSKAELEAERARYEAERKAGSSGDWATQVGSSIVRFTAEPYLVGAYALFVALFCFIYIILVELKKQLVAYTCLIVLAIPASVLGYAAYNSESLSVMLTVGASVVSLIVYVAKHRPIGNTSQ